jgi:hypothetical protein
MNDDTDASRRFVVEATKQQARDKEAARRRSMRGTECPIQRPMFDRRPAKRQLLAAAF